MPTNLVIYSKKFGTETILFIEVHKNVVRLWSASIVQDSVQDLNRRDIACLMKSMNMDKRMNTSILTDVMEMKELEKSNLKALSGIKNK